MLIISRKHQHQILQCYVLITWKNISETTAEHSLKIICITILLITMTLWKKTNINTSSKIRLGVGGSNSEYGDFQELQPTY